MGLVLLACNGCGSVPCGDDHDHGHAHGAAVVSDLDRSVEELLQQRCEHDRTAASCDHCRFEVGLVRVRPEMFDAALGGEFTVADVRTGRQPLVLHVPGEVTLNLDRAAAISPLAGGLVRAVYADLGVRVAAGQVLAELESPEFSEAVTAWERSISSVNLARAVHEREQGLFSRGICPEQDVLEARAALEQAASEARAARARLLAFGITPDEIEQAESTGHGNGFLRLRIRAPFDGAILDRSVSEGTLVQPGDSLFLLGDTSKAWVNTVLAGTDLAAVEATLRAGRLPARVEVGAFPGEGFDGVVERLAGTMDGPSRTGRARVVVSDPLAKLRFRMFVRVSLELPSGEEVLLVPEEAVLSDEGRSFVFIHLAGDDYIRRPVKVGRSYEGMIEVAGEVVEGDIVVRRGAFLLKSDVLRGKMGAGCAD